MSDDYVTCSIKAISNVLRQAEAEMQRRCAEAIKTCASNWTHYETRGDFIAALIKAIEALK